MSAKRQGLIEGGGHSDPAPAALRDKDDRQSQFRSQTASVADALHKDLVAGEYLPGSKLPITALARHYSVSPGAVREALSRLVPEGLVEFSEQRGFRSAPISIETMLDITRIRTLLDVHGLRESIRNGSVDWEAEVIAAHHRLANCPQFDPGKPRLSRDWNELHRRFHRVLVMGCNSTWLLRFHDLLFGHTERYRYLSAAAYERIGAPAPARNVPQEHAELVNAVVARDADRAADLLERHFRLTADRIVQWQDAAIAIEGDADTNRSKDSDT